MSASGLSLGMGAFIAGILLADSSFKHQLETEIEPFKGLLLGLFFIAIGMNLDLSLLVAEPVFIVGMSLLLVLVKALIIYAILRAAKQSNTDSTRVALMLSQGGEFAFVVMTLAVSSAVLGNDLAGQVNLVVGLSMALTSPVVILHSLFYNTKNCPAVYDTQRDSEEPQVIIAGFGRFGQITARVLSANNIAFTAMDKDAEHIAFVQQFGNRVFYGDATRLDLLKKSGIDQARVLLIAIDDPQQITALAKLVKREYPEVKIIARARDRIHATELGKLGIEFFVREMFDGGLNACKGVLNAYGYTLGQADNMVEIFNQHDREMLNKVITEDLAFDELVKTAKQGREELQELFVNDRKQ
jgi:CPA2 family monovalent cation:H+ antiporter-2